MGAVTVEKSPSARALKLGNRERFYHPELDVLRFLAFCAVFIHHAFPDVASKYVEHGAPSFVAKWAAALTQSGLFGVDLFFVLSSYLITELLFREFRRRGNLDIKSFYIRRALRIWPLYFMFVAFAAFVVPHLIPGNHLNGVWLAAFAVFAGNWACSMMGAFPHSVAAPLWSVSVEEQFYLGWPLLLKTIGFRHVRSLAVIFLIVATATRLFLAYHGASFATVWCNTFARLDPIAAGALLATILHGRDIQLSRRARLVMGSMGLCLWICTSRFLELSGFLSLLAYPAVTAGCLLLLISVLRPMAPERSPIFTFLGRISYSLYVFHDFALALVNHLLIRSSGAGRLLCANALAFALVCALGTCSYFLLELPFLRLKSRFTYVPSRPEGSPIIPPVVPRRRAA
jgi:peptidoglycan/LPS O-acetylase OafA/YrhL